MRLLHTGDWHIGKTIRGRSRTQEFEMAIDNVVEIAVGERVDAVLHSGDLYDQRAAPAEADRLIFDALLRLRHAEIPVVAIPGNHDSPVRFEAFRDLLAEVGTRLVPKVRRPDNGGIVEVGSRDGSASARIACVPFISERRFAEASAAFAEAASPYTNYADGVAGILSGMADSFSKTTVNIILAHIFIDGARPGGGERELTMGGAYTIQPSALPPTASYIALGHVHKPQEVRGARAPARYAGSLLQLDFGERDQAKSVYVIDVVPGKPAKVESFPIEGGRRLLDVSGKLDDLPKIAADVGDAYLRVELKTEGVVPGIADRVREILPNALDVRLDYERSDAEELEVSLRSLEPRAQFASYYRAAHGSDPADALMSAFDAVHEDVSA
ncbi:MAG TPA: exonuclease SbcCD subunit D [Actinomycetota bacterium]|nr:exonuclease SbcCD subunit D [Actinomycetota bacterium]